MTLAKDYNSVMARSGDIMKNSLCLDYSCFESGSIAFDYEKLMASAGYTLEEIMEMQKEVEQMLNE